MDGPENTQSSEESAEKAYPVKLKPGVFKNLAESLTPIYNNKLAEARDADAAEEFHRSRLGSLMHQVLEQFEEPDVVPSNPEVTLSRQDIKMVENLVPTPHDAAGAGLRRQWINQLKSDFQSSEFKENSKLWGRKAGSVFQGIKTKFKR